MEKELLDRLLKGFYFQGDYALAWSFIEDMTIGETLGKDLERDLIKYIAEQGVQVEKISADTP